MHMEKETSNIGIPAGQGRGPGRDTYAPRLAGCREVAVVCVRVKRDLLIWQKRPTHLAKETYPYGKRDLPIWQNGKRALHTLAYHTIPLYGKRDLLIWQKGPPHTGLTYLCMAKDTYSYGKKDLHTLN